MKTRSEEIKNRTLKCLLALCVGLFVLQTGCTTLDPRKVDVKMKKTAPRMKITSYTQALGDLGIMTEIYDTPAMKIMCKPLGDQTGSSASTGYEIPRDITEMMKSTLNTIGGKVVYIPYDPGFMQNNQMTGYSAFGNKIVPDVVMTGGITEFDRGLETRGENSDGSFGADFSGLPQDMPSTAIDMRMSSSSKRGLARITLDFNLVDFIKMTGIPKINAMNTMEVRKAMSNRELGISLFGQSFGGKGSIKKVQGRHAAIRLLVEISVIQLVGKHLRLPYWRLLGPDAKPDRYVMEQIANYYRYMNQSEIVAVVQGWLYLYGNDLEVTAQLDEKTVAALQKVCPEFDVTKKMISFKEFTNVYMNIPISYETKRRMDMANWR
jgi:hypothetical protein